VADSRRSSACTRHTAKKVLRIVCVSLDDKRGCIWFLKRQPFPATNLFQECKDGGMNSPLATLLRIHGLPTLFLVGRKRQRDQPQLTSGELEAELKKGL